jgi:hypothetical protein
MPNYGHYRVDINGWKAQLLLGIAKLNGCKLLLGFGHRFGVITKRSVISIIGRTSDREIVEYLAAYLCREIERQAEADFKCEQRLKAVMDKLEESWVDRDGDVIWRRVDRINLQQWTKSFGAGAVRTILRRMHEERTRETAAHPNLRALVKRDEAAVDEFIRQNHGPIEKDRSSGPTLRSQTAYDGGVAAGRNIQWHAGVRQRNQKLIR